MIILNYSYVLILMMLLSPHAYGKDFGTVAQTFPIAEEPLEVFIKRKLSTIDLEKENKKMLSIAKDRIENPPFADLVEEVKIGRIYMHEPVYTLKEDILLPCGKVIHEKGAKVNPLEQMELGRRIFFIDGRKREQLMWLKEKLQKDAKDDNSALLEDRVILVAGNVFAIKEELEKEKGDFVYFDQHGELVKAWNIKAVPAIVIQEGKYLRIEEVKIN